MVQQSYLNNELSLMSLILLVTSRLGDLDKEHGLVESRQALEVAGIERSLAHERCELLLRMLDRLRRPLSGPLDAAAVEALLCAVCDVQRNLGCDGFDLLHTDFDESRVYAAVDESVFLKSFTLECAHGDGKIPEEGGGNVEAARIRRAEGSDELSGLKYMIRHNKTGASNTYH
jgi:hypothetical protein